MTQSTFTFLDTSIRRLTKAEAPYLTHRKNQPYYMIMDSMGVEWLVDSVLDNGRLMSLIKPDTNGKVIRHIDITEYDQFVIILSEADFE